MTTREIAARPLKKLKPARTLTEVGRGGGAAAGVSRPLNTPINRRTKPARASAPTTQIAMNATKLKGIISLSRSIEQRFNLLHPPLAVALENDGVADADGSVFDTCRGSGQAGADRAESAPPLGRSLQGLFDPRLQVPLGTFLPEGDREGIPSL